MKIIKFAQEACPPCKMLGAFLNQVGLQVDEDIDIRAEGGMEKAQEFGVMRTPTLILVDDNGVEVDRVSGFEQNKVKALFAKRA